MNNIVKIKHFCILLFLLFIVLYGYSQDEDNVNTIPNILPPSPDAASLGIFGNVPVGLYTGTAQLNIPLYNYKTKDLNVPISLNYSSNGIMVDQVASWVGMGWNLNGIGFITRVVQDEPDLESETFYPDNLDEFSPSTVTFLQNADEFKFDNQPDIFNYSFNNHSGKFLIDKDYFVRTIPFDNLVIEIEKDADDWITFIITDMTGIRYYFGGQDATEKTNTTTAGPGCGKSYNKEIQTTWYLYKIEHPGGDEINFTYNGFYYNHKVGISQSFTKLLISSGCSNGDCPPNSSSLCEQYQMVKGRHISEIRSENNGYVKFIVDNNRTDLPQNNGGKLSSVEVYDLKDSLIKRVDLEYIESGKGNTNYLARRLFLKRVTEIGSKGKKGGSYEFDYNDIEGLPPRLSFSQDYWGYYNGKNNSYLVPKSESYENLFIGIGGNKEPNSAYAQKGMLTKVKYPTGGSTSFEFEPYTVRENVIIPAPTDVFSLQCTGEGFSGIVSTSGIFSPPVECPLKIQFVVYLNDCPPENYNSNKMIGSLIIKKSGNTIYQKQLKANSPDIHGQSTTTINDEIDITTGQYEIIIQATTMYLTSRVNLVYPIGPPTNELRDVEAGGHRLKRMIDETSDGKMYTKKYFYNTYEKRNTSSGVRIGAKGTPSYYFSERLEVVSCSFSDRRYCEYVTLQSNSVYNLFMHGNTVEYTNVTESIGENFEGGGTEHEFVVIGSGSPNRIWGSRDIPGVPRTDYGWYNGEKKSMVHFKIESGSKVVLEKTEYAYGTKQFHNNEIKGYAVRKNFDPMYNEEESCFITCSDDLRTYILKNIICLDNMGGKYKLVKRFLNLNPYTGLPEYTGFNGWMGAAPNANNKIIATYTHPCAMHPEGYIIEYRDRIQHYDAMEYSIFSSWRTLDMEKKISYDKNGLNPVEVSTKYFYENPYHTLLTRKITTNSKGDSIVTQYKYPTDYITFNTCESDRDSCYRSCNNNYWTCRDACDHDDIMCKQNCADNEFVCKNSCDESFTQCKEVELNDVSFKTTLKQLHGKNMLNYPIDKRIYNGLSIVSGSQTKYDYYGNMVDLYNYESKTDIPFEPSNPFTFIHKYNVRYYLNNKAQKVLKNDDITTYYVWGYKTQYPVIKIESNNPNISIDNIQTVVNELNLSGSEAKASIDIDIANLKGAFAAYQGDNYMFSIYTYKPLVGVTSETDTRGRTIYYLYDGFGRLKEVRDHDYKILKEYEYHYSGEQ